MKRKLTKTVAVASQGGGSHRAFGAGVLSEILQHVSPGALIAREGEDYRLTGFSGTPGGTIEPLFASYRMLVSTRLNFLSFLRRNISTRIGA